MSNLEAVHSAVSGIIQENKQALKNFAHENIDEEVIKSWDKLPLEEFLHHAIKQRALESTEEYGPAASAMPQLALAKKILKKEKEAAGDENPDSAVIPDHGSGDIAFGTVEQANLALRNASWVAVFYLITTDILGPTSAPYAISQLGFVPGSLLFFLFGIVAAYTGYLIWQLFLKMDSAKYPLRNYGDTAGRVFGGYARYIVDFLQAIQLLCNVAVIILGNGQGLAQIAAGPSGTKNVCFSVLVVVWSFAGMIVGQIKSLQKFGFLANTAIWMNLFVCFATMGVVAHSKPNYSAALTQLGLPEGPVITKAVISGSGNFTNQLEACMNIVYSYGGAMVFINFMAEMKRPWDFWKGMIMAQSFIFVVYLLYGLFIYAYQGQFVINPANQGISGYAWQTVLNAINLVSALIAAGLYGNVGIKVVYTTFIQGWARGPGLETKKGRIAWFFMVIIYWAVAFVVASAIPQFSALTGVVGAVCILQFSYTFPPLIKLGFDVQINAMAADGPYDPVTKTTNRFDTWKNWSRWRRGIFTNFWKNLAHLLLFLASLCTAILGCYSSIKSMVSAFSSGSSTSFGCKAPV